MVVSDGSSAGETTAMYMFTTVSARKTAIQITGVDGTTAAAFAHFQLISYLLASRSNVRPTVAIIYYYVAQNT